MISEYDTEIEKLKYYKDKIANMLTKQGILANNENIAKQLEAINTSLAIFQYQDVAEKSLFSTSKYNNDFEYIYEDLTILYELAYKYCITKYEELKLYIGNHLLELEELAQKYEKKNKFETGSTTLGETVFFQASGFEKEINDEITKIDLGEISVTPASKLACFIKTNADDAQCIFTLEKETCLPYSYNHDYIVVPGTRKKNIYDYTVTDEIQGVSMRVMNLEDFTPSVDSAYDIFAGKNMIKHTDINTVSILNITNAVPITCSSSNKGKITFYIKDGSYATFDFSQKPLYTNFSGYSIKSLESIQKIEIDYENALSFTVSTDGVIYADRNTGTVANNFLYYPTVLDSVTDYHIIEYSNEKTVNLDASIIITGQDPDTGADIEYIAIKQLPGTEVSA